MCDQTVQELFQIALINHKPAARAAFDWVGFNPKGVREAGDLPPYALFGPLKTETLKITEAGWTAQWGAQNSASRLSLGFNHSVGRYCASQRFEGIDTAETQPTEQTPIVEVLGEPYQKGFPGAWDDKAKETIEKAYRVTWIRAQADSPVWFGLPDGAFRVICFPVMVANLRYAKDILERIAAEEPGYAFFAAAVLMEQEIFYQFGVAPEWTQDMAAVMTQSIGETGLIPGEIPQICEEQGIREMRLARDVMMLKLFVPFTRIDDMLSRLAETPMQVLRASEAPLRREMLPVIWPQGLEQEVQGIVVKDAEQGIRVVYRPLGEDLPLDELLKRDANGQIDNLERFSKDLLNKLTAQ